MSSSALLDSLKVYGRAAGIAEEKLTLMALRRTATRLRLEAGDNLEEMKAFLESREEPKFTKHRLRRLPKLPPEQERKVDNEESEAWVPARAAKPFKPGEGMTHGFYARSRPVEAAREVLDENIQGMEEQIVGLRELGNRLLERMWEASSSAEAARLGEAYSMAASWLGVVMAAERWAAARAGKNPDEESWSEKN